MKKSEIKFQIKLDENRTPKKIYWNATENLKKNIRETKSISISLWDNNNKNTLRIDLWTKKMSINEMKKFYIDTIGGLSQSILNSTGDKYIFQETNKLCNKLIKYLKIIK